MPATPLRRPLVRAAVLAALTAAIVVHATRPPAAVPASAPATEFSAERAMAHVREIAQRPHPIGSADAVRVRDYVIGQLRALGLEPTVQEATAVGTRYQVIGHAQNVVARLEGTSPGGPAIMLMAHYDGVPAGPAASDDGSGTAVVLELMRALKSGPPLTHDVIALITDGEEAGLLGAAAFVREHPWAKDVATTINFEARGTTGRAYMFETGPGNLDLVRILRKAPDVTASSLLVSVYRTLPNDTDLSEVAQLGKPALNFAFTDGVDRYHTTRDDVEDLDPGSMQQEGAAALVVARAVAAGPLPRPVTGDAVFFDFPLLGVIYYPESVAWPVTVVALLLLVAAGVRVARAERRWLRDLMLGAVALPLSAALAGGVVYGAGMLASRLQQAFGGQPATSGAYAAAFAALALGATAACWALARRWASADGTQLGALLVLGALTAYVTWKVPGGSFLLVWPLIFATFALLLRGAGAVAAELAGLAAAVVVIAILLPEGYGTGKVLLGLIGPGGVVMAVLLAVIAWLLAPQVEALAGERRWRLSLGTLAAGMVLFAFAAATVRSTREKPVRSALIYSLDADATDAWLMASARQAQPESWVASVVGAGEAADSAKPAWLGRIFGPGERAAARAVPRLAHATPAAAVIADSLVPAGRELTLRVTSAPGAIGARVRADATPVLAAVVDGRAVDTTRFRMPQREWSFNFAGVPDSGFRLVFVVPREATPAFELLSIEAGLPSLPGVTIPARPAWVAPSQTGDLTITRRMVRLGAVPASSAGAPSSAGRATPPSRAPRASSAGTAATK